METLAVGVGQIRASLRSTIGADDEESEITPHIKVYKFKHRWISLKSLLNANKKYVHDCLSFFFNYLFRQ